MNEGENRPDSVARQDSESIRAFQAGEKEAFDSLVRRYQNKIFNISFRFLGDYDEANDCAQETFVKVYRSLRKFRFQSSFSTWLYRIAVNTCKNRISSSHYRRDRKSTRLNSSHTDISRMPSSA